MSQSLAFTKPNFILLQKELDTLKKSLEIITEENKKLKTQVHDMKITVKENKKVLNDYIINITNKDKLFEKLNLIIKELKEKNEKLEEKLKQKEKNKINKTQNGDINIEENKDIQNIKERQDIINREIFDIKGQLESLLEVNALKKKLNQNLKNNENNIENLDNSYISQEISDLSDYFEENNKKIEIFPLDRKYGNVNENLTDFISFGNDRNDSIFLIDGKNNIWEIIRRSDLSQEKINNKK